MPRPRPVTAILLCFVTTSLLASNDALIRKMRDRAKEAIEDGEAIHGLRNMGASRAALEQ